MSSQDSPISSEVAVPGGGKLQRNFGLVGLETSRAKKCRPPSRSPKMAMVWNSSACFFRSAAVEPLPSTQMSRTMAVPSTRISWRVLSM